MATKNKQTKTVAAETVAEVLAQTTEVLETNEQVVQQVEHKVTKVDISRAIYKEEAAKEGGIVRKNVIARLIAEAGLTKDGANTYFQNLKKKAEQATKLATA